MGVTIRERPKGSKVFWVFITHHGRRKSKRIGTKKAALEAAAKIQVALAVGGFDIDKPKTPCFRELAERWISLPNDEWKDSTRYSYSKHLELHIYPVFGDRPVDSISRRDLVEFFEELALKGLATATLGVIRATLGGVLTYALNKELISATPLSGIRLKKKAKKAENGEEEASDVYTEEEGARLLAEAEKYQGGAYYPPLLCLLRTGVRIGELQALAWGDVDFNGRFLDVRRSWRQGRLTDTKSKKRRRVDMTPLLVETLRVLQVEEKKRALRQGRPVSEWVFADCDGTMLNRETLRLVLKKCAGKAGLRTIKVHGLRHSYASIRLNRGHDVADVSRQLGHSDISITVRVYGHLIPGKHKSQVDDLDTPQPAAPPLRPTLVEARQH